MTADKAYRVLKGADEPDPETLEEAIITALSALGRLRPRRVQVIMRDEDIKMGYCPICPMEPRYALLEEPKLHHRFCPRCGQALDWGEG